MIRRTDLGSVRLRAPRALSGSGAFLGNRGAFLGSRTPSPENIRNSLRLRFPTETRVIAVIATYFSSWTDAGCGTSVRASGTGPADVSTSRKNSPKKIVENCRTDDSLPRTETHDDLRALNVFALCDTTREKRANADSRTGCPTRILRIR